MNELEARTKALELFFTYGPGGLKWETIVRKASILADFIIDGTVPEEDTK